MPESRSPLKQSDPDFKRVYSRNHNTAIKSINRPSAKYINDVIVNNLRSSEGLNQTRAIQSNSVKIASYVDEPPSSRSNRFNFGSLKQKLVFLMGAALILIGILSTSVTIRQNNTSAEQIKKIANIASADSASAPPSEEKPSAPIASYKVAPNLPAVISIPTLKVEARIKPLGVNSSNKLIAPNNIYDTGWYNASAKPGDSGSNGAMVIEGHVHGPILPGIFNSLHKLAPGDKIKVKRGDGTLFTYKVVKQKKVKVDSFDMGEVLTSVQPGMPGLNLITCSGDYDASGHYEQRLIIFSVLSN